MVVIGITGGIGSGKSKVAEIIRTAGYDVLSSDQTAKQIMNDMPEVRYAISKRFGTDMYKYDGTINTRDLARIVFAPTSEGKRALDDLNAIVHPRVFDEHQRQLVAMEKSGIRLAFLESALLYEAEIEDAFDYIITVDAPEDVRFSRAMIRDNATEETIKHRAKKQLPANDKKSWADFVIDNSGTPEQLQTNVLSLLPLLTILPPRDEDMDDDSDVDSDTGEYDDDSDE